VISAGIGAAALLSAAMAAGAAASQGAGAAEKLTPPKRDDWSSTLLVCAEGKKITAVFTGQDRLTVATPQGEHRLTRVQGDGLRYRNDKAAEFVVEKGQAQFSGAKNGPHKDCKPS
ncbi:MAG: hypothetical protein M3M95_03620, partial [Pseudomonadota bacterium]|nr:hypothetical protein [Pseudomonadota bacterium]